MKTAKKLVCFNSTNGKLTLLGFHSINDQLLKNDWDDINLKFEHEARTINGWKGDKAELIKAIDQAKLDHFAGLKKLGVELDSLGRLFYCDGDGVFLVPVNNDGTGVAKYADGLMDYAKRVEDCTLDELHIIVSEGNLRNYHSEGAYKYAVNYLFEVGELEEIS